MTTPSYPDIERPVERLIVVGAGIAGLTAANALVAAGLDCVVLEARDRIGGRLHTVELAGHPVDLGGSWIHHPIGNPLSAFADRAGLARRDGDPLPALTGYDIAEGRRLSAAELQDSLAMQFERFPRAVAALGAAAGPHASAAEAIDRFVSAAELTADESRRARQALRGVVEADAAGAAENQSLRWLGNEIEYGGDYFGDLPVGGYREVVRALGSGLDIRTGVEVSEVGWTGTDAWVSSRNGVVERGSHVLVTVPLGVLKDGRPRFSPALPAQRQDVVTTAGFGSYEKVVLAFGEPFWRAVGLSHLVLFPREDDLPTVWVFDQDAFGTGPVLVGHVFHTAVDRLGADMGRWVVDLLEAALGAHWRPPTAVRTSSWSTDPYACGAYTHLPPGTNPADLDLLGEPVGGRVLFAGEHTQSARTGFADGAMSSGLREARRLLGG